MGIDQERFVEVSPELICCICTNVFEEPTESPCRHVFCTECISRWLRVKNTCPTCRSPLRAFDMKPPLPLLRNIIGKLRIRCDFIEEGCTTIVDYEQLPNHLRCCPYGPTGMACQIEGCNETFSKRDKERHEAECPYRTVVCSAFSNHGCGMEYKLNEAGNHNCVDSLKAMVRDLQGKVSTLEQTVIELKQGMQALQQRDTTSAQEITHAGSSCNAVRARPQNADYGFISLLSEDEEESEPTPIPRLIHCHTPITNITGFNFMATNLQSENQPQVDREQRQSRALHRSTPSRRERSRSDSPVRPNSTYWRNRESSPSVNRRRTSRMSASCTQTSSSTSESSTTSTQGNVNSPAVRPRRRRKTRQINHGQASSSSQVNPETNSLTSDSDGSGHPSTSASTEASSGVATSPHSSPGYSSSDDSFLLLPDSAQWYQDLTNRYITGITNIHYGTDGNNVTAVLLP